MTRFFHPALLVLLCLSPALAGEKTKMVTIAYPTPPGLFFNSPEGSTPERELKPIEGVVPIDEESHGIYDVKGHFSAEGITFPEGSEATYYTQRSMLVVRNTPDNISLFDTLFDEGCHLAPLSLRNEVTVVTMELPEGHSVKMPTLSDLKKMAGNSWREVARISLLSKSGARVSGATLNGKDSGKDSNLPPDAMGSACEIETVVGPDGYTMDSNLAFQFRGMVGANQSPLNIRYSGTASLWDSHTQILQITSATEKTPAYALLLRVTSVMPSTWPVPPPDTSPEKGEGGVTTIPLPK